MISMSKTSNTTAGSAPSATASIPSKRVGLGLDLDKGSAFPAQASHGAASPAAKEAKPARAESLPAFSRAVEASAPAIRAGAPFQNSLLDPTHPASLLNSTNPLSPLNVTTGLANPASPFSVFKL